MLNLNPQPQKVYYHGSSSNCGIESILMPPVQTSVISEEGRKKNLDQVFFTEDLGLAKVYAGRACNRFGGEHKIFRVIPMTEVTTLNETVGATVYHCGWAFVEEITLS